MTWERDHLDEARNRLEHTSHFAGTFMPPAEGALTGLGRSVVGWGQGRVLTSHELYHTLISAEATILTALVMLTEEQMMSFVKTGPRHSL